MTHRFQIEDLVVQDSSGVVFRALDTETNQTVAVRRFFPFGANGGGLREDEQIGYNIAVERLAKISHPALRAVVCGGCDPIDGMPFIATEWIEGPRLESVIAGGPLDPAAAAKLLSQALEVCQLLSEVLAEEAIWVETSLQAIVVGAEGTGRGVTFWIAPLKWLGKNDGQRGFESIITLAEEIMGWTGKTVSDQAGRGLGGWLKWLRGKARETNLREAREMLAKSIAADFPIPARNPARKAKRNLGGGTKKKKKPTQTFLVLGIVALLSIAASGLALVQWRNSKLETPSGIPPAARAALETAQSSAPAHPTISSEPTVAVSAIAGDHPVSPMSGETPVDRATRRAVELTAAVKQGADETDLKASRLKAEIERRGGIFSPADHELLMVLDNKQVTVEGTFAEIGYSKSRKTMYLLFSKNASAAEARGSVVVKDGNGELAESALAPLVGKKIRLHGKVQIERFANRPVVEIGNRNAIEVIE